MIHYGDVCKINGAKIPKVDIITFGAPCQDLSIAGKRAGMKSALMGDEETTRSGLFFEAIRIIKEMREDDRKNGRSEIRPRYAVYENVPGAFSSNKGEDFRAVLEETAKVADENAVIPEPPKGKWTHAGCIVGDGWSIAWRVHDAQFWGVPQRRKRICLLADFEGETAGKILFKLWRETEHRNAEQAVTDSGAEPRSEVQSVTEGVPGNTTESGKEGEGAATDAGSSIEETGRAISFQERAGKPGGGKGILIQNERTGALSTLNNQSVVYGISSDGSNAMRSSNPNSGIYEAETTRTLDNNGGNPACNQGGMAVVQGFDAYNQTPTGDVAMPLRNKSADADHIPVICIEGNGQRESHKGDGYKESDTMYTLNTVEQHAVCIENHPADSRVKISEDGIVQTLSSRMGTGGGNVPMVMSEVAAPRCAQDGRGAVHSQMLSNLEENFVLEPVCVENGQLAQARLSPTVGTLNCMHDQQAVMTYQEHTGTIDCCISKGTSNQLANNDMFVANTSVVRRLTPLECERLQGFPTVRKVRVTEMTKDEYIAWNINEGHIVVDTEQGKVFATRDPGGKKLDKPRELKGSSLNGYLVVNIRNGETKMQCRIHRIVWIAEYGIIPDGYVIDHINNDKLDNRLCNLQLLTPAENSTKAKEDGLYKIHGDAGCAKITDEIHDFIQYVYGNTDLSIRQLSEIFGISKSRVHQIIHDEPWTDIGDWVDSKGKKHKGKADSPRYKALGNSLALPFWNLLAGRICKQYNKQPTMGSLFSGIGGFELVFQNNGALPVWSSEVEEFAIAVTKKRFQEGED